MISINTFLFVSKIRIPPGGKLEKLMGTLYDKERYIIQYRMLKNALERIEIHQGTTYRVSPGYHFQTK